MIVARRGMGDVWIVGQSWQAAQAQGCATGNINVFGQCIPMPVVLGAGALFLFSLFRGGGR